MRWGVHSPTFLLRQKLRSLWVPVEVEGPNKRYRAGLCVGRWGTRRKEGSRWGARHQGIVWTVRFVM